MKGGDGIDHYQHQIDKDRLDALNDHLKRQRSELAKQKNLARKILGGVPGWNSQLIRDLEANIQKTQDEIAALKKRV